MSKPAFAINRTKPSTPPLSAADLAAADGRARVGLPGASAAPAAPPARKELLRNTSLRLSDAQLDLLDRVYRVTPGCKSRQELIVGILVPALQRMDPGPR